MQSSYLLGRAEPSQRTALIESVASVADDYCAIVEKYYENAGYVRGRQKHSLEQHLEWVVRFQVQCETMTEIAASQSVEVSAVSKAINEFLKLIGLQKRPDAKQGRRLGSKNRRPSILRDLGR